MTMVMENHFLYKMTFFLAYAAVITQYIEVQVPEPNRNVKCSFKVHR